MVDTNTTLPTETKMKTQHRLKKKDKRSKINNPPSISCITHICDKLTYKISKKLHWNIWLTLIMPPIQWRNTIGALAIIFVFGYSASNIQELVELLTKKTSIVTKTANTNTTKGIGLKNNVSQLASSMLSNHSEDGNQDVTQIKAIDYNSSNEDNGKHDDQQAEVSIYPQESSFPFATYQDAVLPLTNWEIESSKIDQKCDDFRPSHVPRYCCIGTVPHPLEKGRCNKPQPVYDMLTHYATSYLDNIPVITSIMNNNNNAESLPKQDCDFCRIIDYLFLYNWTLAFQGDSIMYQHWNGIHCEMLNRGYNVTPLGHSFTKNVTGEYGIIEIHSYRISRIPWQQQQQATTSTSSDNILGTVTISFYFMYRPYISDIREFLLQHDIIVFDHGLHWTPRKPYLYQHDMTTLLSTYKNSKSKLVAWRQTTAQHFDTPGGFYYRMRSVNYTCTAINTTMEGTYGKRIGPNFYYDFMKKAIAANNMTLLDTSDPDFLMNIPASRSNEDSNNEIVVLPYYDFTIPLHYLHPYECTHYCHHPHMWLPVWRWLRIAFERTVAIENNKLI
jgi:hypothetical protein